MQRIHLFVVHLLSSAMDSQDEKGPIKVVTDVRSCLAWRTLTWMGKESHMCSSHAMVTIGAACDFVNRIASWVLNGRFQFRAY